MENTRWLSKVGTWIAIWIAFWLIALSLLFLSITSWRKEREAARASLPLYQAQQAQKIRDVQFYGKVKQVLAVAVPAVLFFSGVMVAVGISRRKQIVMIRIGKHSEFPVHYKQVKSGALAQQLTALVTAEELKQSNAGIDKAFQLYEALADSQSKLLRSMPARAALPAAAPAILSEPGTLAPRFADLLRSGDIAPGKPLIFGFSKGAPRVGTWQDIYSNATGGQSGTGKTITLCSLIGQSLLQGVEFWIIDFHYPHPKSLLAKLGRLKETDFIRHDFDIAAIYDEVEATIDARINGKDGERGGRVLTIDELFRVNNAAPRTATMLERIGTEGRKVEVYVLASAQSWNATKVGGTTARDNLTSIFAHKMKPKQGNVLLQDKDLSRTCWNLRPGQVLFCPTSAEPEILTVPFCEPRDMDTIFEMLPQRSSGQGVDRPVDLTESGELTDIDRVKHLIKSGQLTQKQLAIDLNIDPGFLSRILSGEKNPPERIREALKQL